MTSWIIPALAIACATALLASCGTDAEGVATRVAVEVNAEEITVHQLNAELARLEGLNDEQRKYATGQVLAQLVDQVLLAQRAMERKLDRDPRVAHAIENSKRQILAESYVDSRTAHAARPLPDEVAKFYARHPELFAERRIYRLQELAIASRPELTMARVAEVLKGAKSLNEVVEWLKREKFTFDANSTVKAAEQLPMEVVARLTALKQGQALLMPAPQGYLVVQMAAAELQPLNEEQARPLIEQFLTNQKRRELARAEARALRNAAHIKYVGDFAAAASAAAGSAPTTAALPVPEAGADPAAGNLAIERSVKGI